MQYIEKLLASMFSLKGICVWSFIYVYGHLYLFIEVYYVIILQTPLICATQD